MTHAELRRSLPADPSLDPTDCPGPLEQLGERTGTDGHLLCLWRCQGCTATVVEDLTAGRINNDYIDPRRLIKELAARMRRNER